MKSFFKLFAIASLTTIVFLLCSCGGEKPCEHQFSEWETVLEPTCLNTGLSISRCEICELSKTNILEKSSHKSESIPSVSPTCQETGLTEGAICSVCREILTEQYKVLKVNHNFENNACTFCEQPYYSNGLNFSLNSDENS